jgi:hypothetical protein
MLDISREKWLVFACVLCLGAVPTAVQAAEKAKAVEADAVEAVKAMGAYLRTLKSFELQADISEDQTIASGEVVQRNEHVTGSARPPNGLRVRTTAAGRDREIIYDGSKVTVYGHKIDYYAQFDAPATIRETIEVAAKKYDLEIPLADLFFWGTKESDIDTVTSAFKVGPAQIGDRTCDQYAFRQEGAEWQIWIAQGEQKAPCKLVIIDTSEPSRQQYSAVISVTPDKAFADDAFAFSPPPSAHKIDIVASDTAN